MISMSRSGSSSSIEEQEKAARIYWTSVLDQSQDELTRQEILRLKQLNDSLESYRICGNNPPRRSITPPQYRDADEHYSNPINEIDIDTLLASLEKASINPSSRSIPSTPPTTSLSSSLSPPRRRLKLNTTSLTPSTSSPNSSLFTPPIHPFRYSSDLISPTQSPTTEPFKHQTSPILIGRQLFTSPTRSTGRNSKLKFPTSPTSSDFPTPPTSRSNSIESSPSLSDTDTDNNSNRINPIRRHIRTKRQLSVTALEDFSIDLIELNNSSSNTSSRRNSIGRIENEEDSEEDGWPPYGIISIQRTPSVDKITEEIFESSTTSSSTFEKKDLPLLPHVHSFPSLPPLQPLPSLPPLPTLVPLSIITPFKVLHSSSSTSTSRKVLSRKVKRKLYEPESRVHFRAEAIKIPNEGMKDVVDWSELFQKVNIEDRANLESTLGTSSTVNLSRPTSSLILAKGMMKQEKGFKDWE